MIAMSNSLRIGVVTVMWAKRSGEGHSLRAPRIANWLGICVHMLCLAKTDLELLGAPDDADESSISGTVRVL